MICVPIRDDEAKRVRLELGEIRGATLRRCGKTTHAGRAERKVLAAVGRIEEAVW